jgi:hypothetical protein
MRSEMPEQNVWVRFTVPAANPKEARLKVRRALRQIPLDAGCTEATVYEALKDAELVHETADHGSERRKSKAAIRRGGSESRK